VNAATVPETAVDENRKSLAPKYEIGLSLYGLLPSPASDAVGAQNGNET
jgi:hypothetical protein